MDKDLFAILEFSQISLGVREEYSIFNTQHTDYRHIFSNAQAAALLILGPDKITDAESITTLEKLLILIVFGPTYVEEAKRFPDPNQSEAIKIISNHALAIKVTNTFQVEAFRILGPDKEALQYNSYFQIEALRILGKDHTKLALQFDNQHKLDALRFLGEAYCDLALAFDTREKVIALQIIGVNNSNLALEFMLYSQVTALRLLQDTPERALSFTNNCQTKALEIVGVNNVNLALDVDNHQKILCLEQCVDSISGFWGCIYGDMHSCENC